VNPNRLLGNAATRCAYGFPAVRDSADRIFVSGRNTPKETINSSNFVELGGFGLQGLQYYGNLKPSVDAPMQRILFIDRPDIKYMIHGHCYIDGAPFTNNVLPCGAINEFCEIFDAVGPNASEIIVNLRGHGCLIAGPSLSVFDNIELVERPYPEIQQEANR